VSPIASALLAWYAANARTLPWRAPPGTPLPTDRDWPYRVWLSEIMLQQTVVATVQRYFAEFTRRWPTVADLAAADDADVMKAWAGLGYYARARNLLATARTVTRDHGGRFPDSETALRTLPGIGPYTAAAIAAFAFGQRAIVIDGNVERVVTRLFAISTPLPGARAEIHAALDGIVPDNAGDFAQGLMDLAGRVCTPRAPACEACPLQACCRAAALGEAEQFPFKPPKRPRPTRHGTAWWIESAGQVLTITRPPKGLLGGMRALPSTDWDSAQAAPPFPGDWLDLGVVSHGFTHFELLLRVMAIRLASPPGLAGEWLNADEVADAGLPTLFRKAAILARAQLQTETA
jgi:A/G-specific adenine glycosylase